MNFQQILKKTRNGIKTGKSRNLAEVSRKPRTFRKKTRKTESRSSKKVTRIGRKISGLVRQTDENRSNISVAVVAARGSLL